MSDADTQAEAEQLVNAVLPHAEGMLVAHGEFVPYGGALTLEGDIDELAVDEEHRDAPFDTIVAELKGRLRDGAGAYRATAVVFPVEAQLPGAEAETDAVAIALDHQADFSVVLIIPYVLAEGGVQFGEAVAQQGDHEIFKPRH